MYVYVDICIITHVDVCLYMSMYVYVCLCIYIIELYLVASAYFECLRGLEKNLSG